MSGSTEVKDEDGWDYLMAILTKVKLTSLEDQDRLSRFRPSFPCSFERFVQTIT